MVKVTQGKINGKSVEHDEAYLSLISFKGYWADSKGTQVDCISFGTTARFYIDKFWAYDPKLKISIKSVGIEEVIVEDTINNLNPSYFVQKEQYIEVKLKKRQEYKALQNANELELCCGVSNGFWRFIEQEEVAKIKMELKSIVCFAIDIDQYRKSVVSLKTIDILTDIAIKTENDMILITSTIRSTRKQAEIMYENEANQNHIRYAAPGREVIMIYTKGVADKSSKEKIIQNMDEKIMELSAAGKRVSLHAVTESVYNKSNIIDVSHNGLKNIKQFIQYLLENNSVSKIIQSKYPVSDFVSGLHKISFDKKEPCIHIEIKQ